MLPTAIYPVTLAPYGVFKLLVAGSYFKIVSASGSVGVTFDRGSLVGLLPGQGMQNTPFSDLLFTDLSGSANTLSVIIGDSNFVDTRVTGSVQWAPLQATFSNAQKTVTNASAQLLAANAARRYLLVQNNGSGDIYVTLDSAVATAANGVRLAAGGGSLELATVVPSGAINAIGILASNPNVIVVES